MKYGTVQGSCLGPLLFNIFCNDIYYNVDYCNLILFADDTTLYTNHRNSTYLNYILQHDFDKLEKWFRANRLSLNLNKTSTTSFWSEKIEKPIRILTPEGTLPREESTKFLGVTIDNKLTWTQHIDNIITKLNTNKILLGKSKHLLNQSAKRQIYFAHIHSYLAYANTVWSNYTTGKQKNTRKNTKILRESNIKNTQYPHRSSLQVAKNNEI